MTGKNRISIFFLIVLVASFSARLLCAQQSHLEQTDKSGIELVSDGPISSIRFPVIHWHNVSECFGYLYFSPDAIRYEPVYPLENKDHAFRYLRSDLSLAKEYYGTARLEFRDGHKYSFTNLARFVLPYNDLLQAATEFDAAVTAARTRIKQRATQRVPSSAADPLSLAGEILQNGDLRFAVAHFGGTRSLKEVGVTYSSYGYLNFSKDSIRYEVTSGKDRDAFNLGRSALVNAKEYHGLVELKFQDGTHRFTHILAQPPLGSSFKLYAPHRDVLEAVESFPTALAKAEATDRDVAVLGPASMPLSAYDATALETEEKAAEAAEQQGQPASALQHFVAALKALPQSAPQETEESLRQRIIKLALVLNPPPAIPEEARRHSVFATTALGLAEKDPAQLDSAIKEWQEALRIAPWWAESYFNAGLVLEKRHRYAEAMRYLKFYLLAAPGAKDADAVQQKIYSLEYLAQQKGAQ